MRKTSIKNLLKITLCLGMLSLIGILSAFWLGGKPSTQAQADEQVLHTITLNVGSKTGCDVYSVTNLSSAGFNYDSSTKVVSITSLNGKASFIVNLILADECTADLSIASTQATIQRNSLTQFVVTINGNDAVVDTLNVTFGDAHKFTLTKEFCEIYDVTSESAGFFFNKQSGEITLMTDSTNAISFTIVPIANKFYQIVESSFQTNEVYFNDNGISHLKQDDTFVVTINANSTKLGANIKLQAEPIEYNLVFECKVDNIVLADTTSCITSPTGTNKVMCGNTLFNDQDKKYVAKTVVEKTSGGIYTENPQVFNKFVILDKNGDIYKTLSTNYEKADISDVAIVSIEELVIDSTLLEDCLTNEGELVIVAMYRSGALLQLGDLDLSKYQIALDWTGWYYKFENFYYVETSSSITLDLTRVDKHSKLETITRSVMDGGDIYELSEEQITTNDDGNYEYSFIIPDDNYYMEVEFGINPIEYEIIFTCYNESINQDIEEGPIQLILGEGFSLEYKAPYNAAVSFNLEDELEGYEFKCWVITKTGGDEIINSQSGNVIINSEDYIIDGKITIKAYFTQLVGLEVKIPTTYKDTSVDYLLYTVVGETETPVTKTTNNRYQFYYGTTIKLVATSSEYIEFVNYVINNASTKENSTLTTEIKEDSQILVNFKNVDVAYNFNSDLSNANGKLEVSSDTMSIGKALIIAFNSNAGYSVSDWKINGKPVDVFVDEMNNTYGNIINYSAKSNTLTIRANEAFIEYIKENGLQSSVSTSINSVITVAVLGGAILIIGSLVLIIVLVFMNAKKKKQMATADQVASAQSKRMDNDYLQRLREGKE